MIEMGILDPTKVTRAALQNAASIAGLLITTEAMVAEIPEDKTAPGDARHGRRNGWHGRHDVDARSLLLPGVRYPKSPAVRRGFFMERR